MFLKLLDCTKGKCILLFNVSKVLTNLTVQFERPLRVDFLVLFEIAQVIKNVELEWSLTEVDAALVVQRSDAHRRVHV